MPACSRRRIPRISAWVVTSRAVVGSSHSRSFGSTVRAPAIITRCSMPPESSCGYCRRCRSASSSPTARSSSTARVARPVALPAVVEAQRLGEEVADPADRVDARPRVLEDHRDLGPAQRQQPSSRDAVEDVAVPDPDVRRRPRRRRATGRGRTGPSRTCPTRTPRRARPSRPRRPAARRRRGSAAPHGRAAAATGARSRGAPSEVPPGDPVGELLADDVEGDDHDDDRDARARPPRAAGLPGRPRGPR